MRIISIFMALLSTSAWATDFTKPILDEKGQPARERMLKEGGYDLSSNVVTIGMVAAAGLLSPPQADPRSPQDPLALAKRAILALKIREAKDLSLVAEETMLIKSSLSIFPPLTVLRVLEAIDPAAVK